MIISDSGDPAHFAGARNFDQEKKLQLAIEALCKGTLATFTDNANDAKDFFGVVDEFVLRRSPDAFMAEDDLLAWADLEPHRAVIVDQDEGEPV